MPRKGQQGNSTGARSRPRDQRQRSLFDDAADNGAGERLPTGRLNIDIEWRAALNDAIDESGLTRDVIAAEMTRLLGADPRYSISKANLDAWTAGSRTAWRFPVIYLPAFIEVTGASWLLDRLARMHGRHVVDDDTLRLAEIGRTECEIDRLQGRSRTIRDSLAGAR